MYEVNLVPDIKRTMIKTIKLRNLILFFGIVISVVLGGVVLVLLGIKGGQDLTMSSQDGRLDLMSETLNSYDDLDDLLTLQSQLNQISDLGERKTLLSRVFNVMGILLPTSGGSISISELSVDMENSALNFEAQANDDGGIDYRILESFRKSVGLMKFDYGRYVDENGEEIPTRCIEETDENGDEYIGDGLSGKGNYAIWLKGKKGCDLAVDEDDDGDESGERTDEDTGERVVIWRTPQFDEWYRDDKIDLDGNITDVAHFESQCIEYSGVKKGEQTVEWSSVNNCNLADEEDGFVLGDNSNGRDSSGELVLRFAATIHLNPEVFMFKNKHMMAIAPTGRTNVTDSYSQIENMFSERAIDCEDGDVECRTATTVEKNNGDEE